MDTEVEGVLGVSSASYSVSGTYTSLTAEASQRALSGRSPKTLAAQKPWTRANERLKRSAAAAAAAAGIPLAVPIDVLYGCSPRTNARRTL